MHFRFYLGHVSVWIGLLDGVFWGYVCYVMVYQLRHPQFSHYQGTLLLWLVMGLMVVLLLNGWLLIHFHQQLNLVGGWTTNLLIAIFLLTIMLMPSTWIVWAAWMIGLPFWINVLVQSQRLQQKIRKKR